MFPSQDARNISFSLIFKCFLVVAFRQTLVDLGLMSCAMVNTDGFNVCLQQQ
jgi:hypothetical protein